MRKGRVNFSFSLPAKGLECCNAEILLHIGKYKSIAKTTLMRGQKRQPDRFFFLRPHLGLGICSF